ncbi:MAG: D-threonine aldolase [Daejeonella sp.]|nr:D-threonine aldolase [Daejeonella sp.]
MESQNWFTINNAEAIDSPALLVYPQRVKENIKLLLSMIDDKNRLRPHVKTFKNIEVAKLMMEAGIAKFKCATISEAEMLAMAQAPDVLLAYQPTGPKLKRFFKLIEQYPSTTFSCLIDTIAVAEELSTAANGLGIKLAVYIDLNVGMNRTGVAPENAFSLYEYCSGLSNVIVKGLHVYDGHIHDASLEARNQKFAVYFESVIKLKNKIINSGYSEPVVIAGGTPTFPILAEQEHVECSPGTFVYWDKGYQESFQEQAFIPAALIITRVISLPDDTKICLDLGHKSVASEKELSKRIIFLNHENLTPVSQSEEHLVMEGGENHGYKVGDILYGLPFHICPSVALYERAITIENSQVSGEWKTIARDRKISI